MSGTPEEAFSFAMHEGRVLVERLAGTYPTLKLTVIESAQNAIDAKARRVFIGIDLKASVVVVLDDGDGISPSFFAKALMSVGQGVKDDNSMGRFGLGMVAPVNKCERYRLISRPKGSDLIREWLFEEKKLRPKAKIGRIPSKLLAKMPRVPAPFDEVVQAGGLEWRTMALLTGVTKDRAISEVDLDELAGQIRTKLGRGMRRRGAVVHVMLRSEDGTVTQKEVNPLNYLGEPLEVVTVEEELCGKVEFRLFRAPKTNSPGVNVLRMGDNSSFSFMDFWKQANGSGWLRDTDLKTAFDALKSGFFEGDIQIENAELNADRESFKMGDPLRASYIAIYQWYVNHGAKLYQGEKRARRDARWITLGEESLSQLYELMASNASFASITPTLTASVGMEREGSARPQTSDSGRVTARHPSDRPKRTASSGPKPGDPRVQRRSKPEREPTRLKFGYETLPESMNLWEFDFDTATIVFNVRHPLWAACDETDGKRTSKHDRQVVRLHVWVATKVLRLLARHPAPVDFESARWEVDDEVPLIVPALVLA